MLALLDHHLLDLGGTHGHPEAGEPIQYDELRIEHDQGDVEIVVYNRALLLFTGDSEAVRRIHQARCAAGSMTSRFGGAERVKGCWPGRDARSPLPHHQRHRIER